MKFKRGITGLPVKQFGRIALLTLVTTLSVNLMACGGGGGGGGTVTNNGTLSNPKNFTLPAGGVSTVPPNSN